MSNVYEIDHLEVAKRSRLDERQLRVALPTYYSLYGIGQTFMLSNASPIRGVVDFAKMISPGGRKEKLQ